MKYHLKDRILWRTSGYSLLEFLLATWAGLMLTAAALGFYRSQRTAFEQAVDLAQMDEAGRTALDLIAMHARMAGFPADALTGTRITPLPMPVVTCAGGYPTGALAQPHCNADSRRSDGVQFNYAADPVSTWPTIDGAATDCLGQALPTGALSSVRFFVKLSASTGEPELYCEGAGRGTAQPVVEGVETLRLRYWLKGDTTPATQLDSQSISRLRLISVCVLVRGRLGSKNSVYFDCDGEKRQSTDRRRRRAYRIVLTLRNLIEPQANE